MKAHHFHGGIVRLGPLTINLRGYVAWEGWAAAMRRWRRVTRWQE